MLEVGVAIRLQASLGLGGSFRRVHIAPWIFQVSRLLLTSAHCILDVPSLAFVDGDRYSWDYVMVFEVRAEDKELTNYQRRFSMKEILARFNAGGE